MSVVLDLLRQPYNTATEFPSELTIAAQNMSLWVT